MPEIETAPFRLTPLGKLGTPALRLVLSRLFAGGGANLEKRFRERGTHVA